MRYDIQLPDSKSIKIRQMMVSFVLDREIPPVTEGDAHDVHIVRRALCAIRRSSVETFHETSLHLPTVIDVEDCGTAYRFLMPLLAVKESCWLLTGTSRLMQRPIEPLVSVLQGIGADIRRVGEGWIIHGKMLPSVETLRATSLQQRENANKKHHGGLSLTLDASQSSQMASALVLAAPLLNLRTLRLITPDIPSLSYLKMTLACTRHWPVEIPGVDVPDASIGLLGDWSAALFWFAHACLHPDETYSLSPLSLKSIQGDSVIYQWFSKLNIDISTNDSSVVIHALPLDNVPKLVLDVHDNLDTVPVMAALAALLPADITFLNVRNLQYKESDRLAALTTQLRPYADLTLADNTLQVIGKGRGFHNMPCFDTHHDHRLAMAFLLFGPSATLSDTDCLKKSYPELLKQI